MREIWGYDVRRPNALKWRWALLCALVSAWLAGCAERRQFWKQVEQDQTAQAKQFPCDADSCGKTAR